MMPYPSEMVLDNSRNYGIVKTETLFNFGLSNKEHLANKSFGEVPHFNWVFTPFEKRSLRASSPTYKSNTKNLKKTKRGERSDKKIKKKHTRAGKVKNCILKVFKKKGKKNRRNQIKMHSKYMVPLILGLLAAKSLLIPIALKAVAFISAKGLMMGFFSTALASILSLKGMFDRSQGYQNRKDDSKTQVEIIHVPTKSEDHIYYDDHYDKGNYLPMP